MGRTLLGPLLAAKLLLDSFRWQLRPMIGLGAALGAVLVFGATVQPWYLLWAAIPLASAAGNTRFRTAATAISAAFAVALPSTGTSFDGRTYQLPYAYAAADRRGHRVVPGAQVRPDPPSPSDRPGGRGRGHRQDFRLTCDARLAGLPPLLRTEAIALRRERPFLRPAVELSGLVKRFGQTTAVDGLSLRLDRGQVLALLGPNGAGKTTTVEVCEGFLRRDAGEVQVLGLDPATQHERLRPRIGVMPQGGGAYPGVRAEEMLALVAACAADPIDPAWLIEVLGLSSSRRTPYKRLSGGQQQRLSLACALVSRPELVFLDEPTAGMDPQARRLVWELVRALRADGVSVLLTTHVMEEAEELADHVVIIDHGRVVAEGSPSQLTTEEPDAAQLRFRAQAGLDLTQLCTALPTDCRLDEPSPGMYLLTGRVDPQVVSAVTAWCAQQGVLAEELHVGRRSLEDVFLELTGRELR